MWKQMQNMLKFFLKGEAIRNQMTMSSSGIKKKILRKKSLHTGAVSLRCVSHNEHSSTATDLAGISMWRSPDWALIF